MWKPVAIPASPGRFRAASLRLRGGFVVWTDEGLYRFLFGGATSIRMSRVYTPATMESRFDRLKRTIEDRAGHETYELCGEIGPKGEVWTPPPATSEGNWYGHTLETSENYRRFTLRDAAGNAGLVADVTPGSKWLATEFTYESFFTIIDSGGVRMWVYQKNKRGEAARWERSGSKAEAAALLKAIIDNPDDDTPRLVFADWLQEHDDPERAEFIRVQCQIAREEQKGLLKKSHPLIEKQWEHAQMARWLEELPTIPGVDWCADIWGHVRCVYRRGFPSVSVTGKNLARLCKKVWSTTPVEAVDLGRVGQEDVTALLDCPYLDRIRWLRFDPGHDSDAGPRLLNAPQLAKLRVLGLEVWQVPDEVRRAMARTLEKSKHLTALESLVWSGEITAGVASALTRAKHLPALCYFRWGFYWKKKPAAIVRTLRKRFKRVETE